MSKYLFLFIAVLFLLAVTLQETSVLTLVYLLAGVFLAGRWWADRTLRSVDLHRRLNPRMLLGEQLRVRLEVVNRSWLPIPWIRIHESLPVELAVPNFFSQAVALTPKGKASCEYVLRGNKRGFYRIGPLYVQSGDLFGLENPCERQGAADRLTVYPKIVPIRNCPVPSLTPMGGLRFHKPFFEDPSRTIGKREYQTGDSLRQIDWKASAATAKLQVRQFQPAIFAEVAIFLNLCEGEFEPRSRLDAAELAVVTAASLAVYVAGKQQPVGLETNGSDPLDAQAQVHSLPVRKGVPHLLILLERLARIQLRDGTSFVSLIRERSSGLAWGTTLMIITGMPDMALYHELLRIRRKGLQILVFLTAPVMRYADFASRARSLGLPVYEIRSERELERILL